MEVNFSNNPNNPATPTIDVAATVVPAPAAPVAAVVPSPAAPVAAAAVAVVPKVGVPARNNMLLGDTLPDLTDMIIPRINLVQNIGDLKDSFPSGSLVYDQRIVLYTPAAINVKAQTIERPASGPVNMTFLGFRPTKYVEKVSGGARGMMVNSEAEVRNAGGTLDYGEWKQKRAAGMKRFEYMADALVAIERPEICPDDSTVFTFEIGPLKYTLALWAIRGTAYTHLLKKVIFYARRFGALKAGGYPSWSYSLSTREQEFTGEEGAKNHSWIPVAIPRLHSTPEFIAFARDILTGGDSGAPQDAAANQ